MHTHNNVKLGFIAIIILMIVSGGISLISMVSLTEKTEKMYDHPFTVSNAVHNINTHLHTMNHHMKDVILAQSEEELSSAVNSVKEHETIVVENFDIVFDRFLGNKEQVRKTYQEFLAWKGICDEVIDAMTTGDRNKAELLTSQKSQGHIRQLNESAYVLIDFATGKAEEFYSRALREKEFYLTLELLLFTVALIASSYIAVSFVNKYNATNKKIKNYFNLIDQNIMIDTMDRYGVTENISNALCRFIGQEKKDITGINNQFFYAGENKQVTVDINNSIRTGELWKGEYQLKSSSGDLKWVYSSIHPILDQDYNVIGYKNILLDISDRKAVENLSITDELTSLYNRRHFSDVFSKQIQIQRRRNSFLTLVIMDVDYFKKYNDRYGHPAGDKVLSKISTYLKEKLKRPNDYVFRLGGEEFAILFSDSDFKQSSYFVDQIKNGIEKLEIKHEMNPVSDYVTVSLGACVYKGSAIPPNEAFYVEADESLYLAKENGRNRVEVKSGESLRLVEQIN